MQFGIGLLGNGWTLEGAVTRQLANTLPAHPSFPIHAHRYAAKIAKETILSDLPSFPDLTTEGIVKRCAGCSRPVRPSEAPMVRDAFLAEYGTFLQDAA